MAIDMINDSNFLNEVLDEKYCNFLEGTDKKKDELENILDIQNSKKNEIIQSIYDSDTYSQNREIYQQVILKVQEIMEHNISALKALIDDLKVLNMAVVRLVVDKSTQDKYQSQDLTQTIHYIKDKVDEFQKKERILNKVMKKDEKTIVSYLKNPYSIEESLIKPLKCDEIESSATIDGKINEINSSNCAINESKIRRRQGSAISFDGSIGNEQQVEENDTLLISEREGKVYLPYKVVDLEKYISSYPNEYENYQDVISREFVLPLEIFMKNQTLSRFKETYELIRNREFKSMVKAVRYSTKLMFRYELNPAIIAACKSQKELELYLNCMQNNSLEDFDCFNIKFDLNLL